MDHGLAAPRRRTRTLLTVAAATVAFTSLGTTSTAVAERDDDADRSLRIMLTNDDGWNAPGIRAVYDALVAAGHDVTLVAPAANQSGSGARATFGGPLVVTQPEPGKYAVNGSPADAAEFGLSVVFADAPPDVVVSGTNEGQNIAAAAIHSGTVGAAVTALNEGVPAIAISTETSFTGGATPPFAATAGFLVDLLAELDEEARGRSLLPDGLGLNVNYPIVDAGGAPTGVALTRTGTGFLDIEYGGAALPAVGGSSTYTIAIALGAEPVADADSTALAGDQVAITVIGRNYDLDAHAPPQLRRVVRALD